MREVVGKIKTIFHNDKNKILPLVFILIVYVFLGVQQINAPFIHVSEDTNGSNGMAAYNWNRFGIVPLKAGLVVKWLPESEFQRRDFRFYADHPVGFLFPTYILYKILGMHEWTTRLAPFLLIILAVTLFYFALQKIFFSQRLAFLGVLCFVLLPGAVYYGKHLDMQPPALAWSLISFSLFVFYFYKPNWKYLLLLFFSVFLGGLIAWHYYFMPFAIWIFLLLTKSGKAVADRRLLLLVFPLIVTVTFVINLWHIYFLEGLPGLVQLKDAFWGRSGAVYIFKLIWYKTILSRALLNFTPLFLFTGAVGFLYFLFNERSRTRKELLLLLWIMPMAVILIFQQWSMHPFGVIYFMPLIGVFSGVFLSALMQRGKEYAVVIATIFLGAGLWLSLQKLDYFYNKFLILGPNDLTLIKELKNEINDYELCLGRDPNLYYGGIVSWYLKKTPSFSPDCLEDKNQNNVRYALVFRFNDEFHQAEVKRFFEKGFQIQTDKKIGKCADWWCLLVR